MSAKNRGAAVREDEFYATPAWTVDRLVEARPGLKHTAKYGPCAGTGNIVRAVPGYWETGDIVQRADDLPHFRLESFLGVDRDLSRLTIVENPPFSKAFEMIGHAVDLGCEDSYWLTRLGLLESAERAEDWHRLVEGYYLSVYVLPNRPSFTGKGTDATPYGWLRIHAVGPAEVVVLGLTDRKVIAAAAKLARGGG